MLLMMLLRTTDVPAEVRLTGRQELIPLAPPVCISAVYALFQKLLGIQIGIRAF